MSKQNIAPTRGEGIPTPGILAETPESGNTPPFSVATFAEALETAITNEGIGALEMVIERLGWIADLADISRDAVELPDSVAVNRMHTLAVVIGHIADETANIASVDLAQLRDEHLPRLLAALPNGGEA